MIIHSLYVYPIKSCKGISLKSVHAGRTGLKLDRQWMLVKKRDMSFVTQRSHPNMSQIEVSLCDQELTTSTTSSEASHTPRTASAGTSDEGTALPAQSHGTLRVEYPSQPTMTLPISPSISQDQPTPATAIEGSGIVQAKVWEWRGDVWDEGDAAAEWFSTVLDEQVRLVRYIGDVLPAAEADSASREVSAEFAPGHETAFADGFPILLATEASRRRMEEEAGIPLEMERFRPNVVVAGDFPPFAEDAWGSISTGRDSEGSALTCHLVKPCTRCTIPDVNPATGVTEGREASAALKELRTGKVLQTQLEVYGRPEWKNRIFFGWNVVVDSTGLLSVGDSVEVEPRV